MSGIHQWSVMLPTSAQVAQEVYEPLIFFSTSADAMWAVCPGHHRRKGNTAYRWEMKHGPEPTQNANPTKTNHQNSTKTTTKTFPSISVVFPLYGCETGEKMIYQMTKGLNSLRKAKCIWTWGCSRRPIKGGLSLLAGAWSLLPL